MSENFCVKAFKPPVNKTNTLLAVTLVLLLSASALLPVTLMANAQTSPVTIPTQTFIDVSPNPIGVGQVVNVGFWLNLEPPQTSTATYYGWNITVSIITPEGANKTYGPYQTPPNGAWFMTYTPETIGTYIIQANFAGVTVVVPQAPGIFTAPGTYYYPASQSRPINLNVTNTQVQPWPDTPLPTGYWQTPIFAENRLWGNIAGNWLSSGSSPALSTQAPNTAHVLWTKPLTFGGISGGSYSGEAVSGVTTPSDYGVNYYTGLLYQNKFSPIVISGYLYYNMFPTSGMFGTFPSGVECVSLRTGQVVWENASMPQINFGQVLTFQSGDQSGSLAYLWATSSMGWQMFDAFTGRLLTTFQNVTGGSRTYGHNGEILVYTLNSRNHWISLWNSTRCVIYTATQFAGQDYIPQSSPTYDWSRGIQWNVTLPTVPGTPSISIVDYSDGVIVASTGFNLSTNNPVWEDVGYSTINGEQLWVQNRTNVGWGDGGPSVPGLYTFGSAVGEGYYAFFERETMQWHVINVHTGTEAFATQPLNEYTNDDWSYYDWSAQIAYGMLYTDGYSGDVVAFNLTTGQHMWTFSQGNSGVETPYGTWPSFGGVTIADGKVFFGVTQHTPGTPLFKGYNLYGIDAASGQLLWKLPGFFASLAVADGELVGYAGYDNQIYAFGVGQSATTVTATSGVGNVITIQGTVTDQSPGQTCLGVPAAGTPAVSDKSMNNWMEYLYQQQPTPANATGVPVQLSVVDPNNNTYVIGTATSDTSGAYGFEYVPPVPGLYKVIATFAGTASYYASSATTFFTVSSTVPSASAAPVTSPSPLPSSTVQPTLWEPTSTPVSPSPSVAAAPTQGQSNESYIVIAGLVIVIVIAVAALVYREKSK